MESSCEADIHACVAVVVVIIRVFGVVIVVLHRIDAVAGFCMGDGGAVW